MNRSLSSSRVTLKRQLDEQSIRERTSENKWKTSSRSKDGKIAELEKMIETLRAEKDAHHGSRSECDEKLAEAEGAQRAEAIRSERRVAEQAQCPPGRRSSNLQIRDR